MTANELKPIIAPAYNRDRLSRPQDWMMWHHASADIMQNVEHMQVLHTTHCAEA